MDDLIVLNLWQFAIIYLLLIVILLIMKKCKVRQSKLLIVASIRMTVQLVLAGLILTYILNNPHWGFVMGYLVVMTGFAIFIALSRNKGINKRFKLIVGASLAGAGLSIIVFFILVVVGANFFNPRYTIPISGMIMGNAMTGVALGLKAFDQNLKAGRLRIETLLAMGVAPQKILTPIVGKSFETALLPTLNSMLGMGIISLPGMMTGQILSGTAPMTAILYQIAILIAISAVVCLAVFSSLFFGYRTLYNKRCQMIF